LETKFVNILPIEGVLKANIVDSHINKRKILVAPHTAEMEIGVDFLPMEPVSSFTGGLEYNNLEIRNHPMEEIVEMKNNQELGVSFLKTV
jgi:hypothetical protein